MTRHAHVNFRQGATSANATFDLERVLRVVGYKCSVHKTEVRNRFCRSEDRESVREVGYSQKEGVSVKIVVTSACQGRLDSLNQY